MEEQKENISSLFFLERLAEYSFDSKMIMAQKYSCKIMAPHGITIESCSKYTDVISPSEIDIFTLFSIIYDSPDANKNITETEFCEFITGIRNHRPSMLRHQDGKKQGEDYFMLMALQQFPVEGAFLIKLFRYNYFFTFQNKNVNMKDRFAKSFGTDYIKYAAVAYIVHAFLGLEMQNTVGITCCLYAVSRALENKTVLEKLKTTKDDYKAIITSYYGNNPEDLFYGIKLQYIYPFIDGVDCVYIPQPYLVVNAVTDSLLNRLTENDKSLRSLFGKEVLESYLYHIYSKIPSVSWISGEIEYDDGKLSPDVIAVDSKYCLFFDTKAKSPRLKLRQLNRSIIEDDIEQYAKNIVQLFARITDFIEGKYNVGNGNVDKNNIFGVSVVLEDSYIPREQIYLKAFEIISAKRTLSQEEKNFIHGRIKIMPLRAIEEYALRSQSIVSMLVKQLSDISSWNNYQFIEEFETKSFIKDFDDFHNKIIKTVEKITNV